MGLFDFLFDDSSDKSKKTRDWDRSVFDNDRFRNRNSGNWVDWEDVSTGDVDLSIPVMTIMVNGKSFQYKRRLLRFGESS